MFSRYLIINNNYSENLYLYIYDYYKFNSNLLNSKFKRNTMFNIIYKYIKLNKIKFKGNKIFFVFNGIVIGYVLTNTVNFDTSNSILYYEYIDKIIDYNNVDKTESIPELIDNYVSINFSNI